MGKLDTTYNVVPGLEFLADNPEFLTEKIETLSDKCKAIYIPRAYIPKNCSILESSIRMTNGIRNF